MTKTAVIALGGNAILQQRQRGTYEEQLGNIRTACEQISRIAKQGWRVVLSHGNGPQVGNILIQNEESAAVVPPMPLDVCGAQTQGMIGYLFQRELSAMLPNPVLSLITQVVVDETDPAFSDPTKPVGPFYTPARAERSQARRGWTMKEVSDQKWRRVVPSPQPRRIVEVEVIRRLVDSGVTVIACGGGGVPVVESPFGLRGVEAVIDKDLAARCLASELEADLLLILTDVPQVYLRYGQPEQVALTTVTRTDAEQYLREGHFRAGSMKAKVEAAVQFVRSGGRRAVIASLSQAADAVEGNSGTHFVETEAVMGRSTG